MVDIIQLGYDVDTANILRGEDAIDMLTTSTKEADRATKQLGRTSQTTGASIRGAGRQTDTYGDAARRASGHTGNLFAQLNDIAVMTASGQSPLILAAQQGTQVNQVFAQMGGGARNAIGGLIGAVRQMVSPMSLLTLGVIAGGSALVQWGISALGARDKGEDLSETLKEIQESAEEARRSLRADLIGVDENQVVLLDRLAQLQAEIVKQQQLSSEITARDNAASLARLKLTTLIKERTALQEQLAELREIETTQNRLLRNTEATADAERLVGEQLQQILARRREAEATATGMLAELQREVAIQATIKQFGEDSLAVQRLRVQQEREIYAEQIRALPVAQSTKDALLAAKNEALALSQINIADGINAGADAAIRLADNLGIAVGEARALLATQNALQYSGRGGDPRDFDTDNQFTDQFNPSQDTIRRANTLLSGAGGRTSGGSSGGGGVSREDTFAEDLEALQQSLMNEREVIEVWYAENETLLSDHRARKELGEQDHKEALVRLEEEYHDRLRGIQDGSYSDSLSRSASYFGSLAEVAAQGGNKLLQVSQAFGAAEALINTYRAQSQTLADPSLPFFAKFAAAAKIAAAGFGLVRAIRGVGSSTNAAVSGIGSAGSVGTGAEVAAPAAQAEPTREIAISFIGANRVQEELISEVLKQISEASEDGVNFVVN